MAFLAAHSIMANAADTSTINITGNVVASPCVVNASNSVINIDLGDIQASSLATAGAFGAWQPFSITLTGCPVSTTKVTAAFAGTPDATDATRYKNQGTASNLTVELVGANSGNNLGNGKTTFTMVSGASKSATFDLKTRAYSNGTVMPGTINASVVASFTYN
ncbi:hypothetical protein IV04_11420 [Serratia sp. Ag1]|nr:hypothetical protein JV45_08715 [Serratia sp. Ag2]KFK98778.1 hypothetical protein IV04_11420 [Serratia sp. Ag1]